MESNEELDLDDGFVPATNPTKEDYEAVVARNRKLYARTKKAEAAKRANGTTDNANSSATDAPASTDATGQKETEEKAWKERMELKTEGYSEEEIAFIQQSGGRKALENTYVKSAIDAMRAQKKSEEAIVETTGGKSDIEKQYTPQQLKDMPTAELEKLLPKAQQ
jgi:hypothetical protein